MKKLILLIAAAGLFIISNVSAQIRHSYDVGTKLGIGADFAFPNGDMADLYKTGFGGTIEFQQRIAHKLNFSASAGFLSFKGDDQHFIGNVFFTGIPPRTFSAVPVKVGLRYFLVSDLYIGAETGVAFDVSGHKRFRGLNSNSTTSSASFIYTPQIGFEFPVSEKRSIDLSARYECWKASDESTKRFTALRLGYNFGR
jgi:hypothetical protein